MTKIAYVCADAGIPVFGDKGASIHIQEMVRAFAAIGHGVRVLCVRSGSVPASDNDIWVEESAGANMAVLKQKRETKERALIAMAEAIEQRLLRLHSEWPFEFIYERYSLWSTAGCRAGRKLGVPVVVEVNAPLVVEQAAYRNFVLEAEARAIESEIVANASALVAVSSEVARYLVDRGADPDKVHVIHNAVDTAKFSPDAVPIDVAGVPDDRLVVGFTGSLKMWHGVDTLLEGFRLFHARNPDAHLLIVGDGPKRGWIEGFACGANLRDAVTVTGWMPHERLPGLLARMDIACAPYPASSDHYFSPLKLYEYLAMGRPVIASRIGQIAELLDGAKAALLIEPGDPVALSTALRRLQDDHRLAGELRLKAAAVGQCHDWRNNARKAVDIAFRVREAA